LRKEYTEKFENIVFRGFVEDLSSELADSIMIVPLRIGSGVRIKIVDAINNGVPLVSTSIGCEGLNLINQEDAFISDNGRNFIDSVLKLADDDSLCEKFRKNAYRKLNEKTDAESLVLKRLNIYERLLRASSN